MKILAIIIALLAAFSISQVSTAPPAFVTFTPLHTYFISPTGSDANNGTSAGTPWLTPNHAGLVCGDVIIAAAGAYNSGNFDSYSAGTTKWGVVGGPCPSTSGGIDGTGGVYFVNLLCASYGQCTINATTQYAMDIDQSNWAVTGWQASQQVNGDGACFQSTPTQSTNHSIAFNAFINNIAFNCSLSGFGSGSNPQNNALAVDEWAAVGNIVYNGAPSASFCGSGISVNTPINVDATVAGTHIWIEQNFAFGNINGPCNPNSQFVGAFFTANANYSPGTTTLSLTPSSTGTTFTPTFTNGSSTIGGYAGGTGFGGINVNSPVIFQTTGAMPTGLSANTAYYVKTILTTSPYTFTVSATQGGAAITVSSAGSGTFTGYMNGGCMPQCIGANWPIQAGLGQNSSYSSPALPYAGASPTLTTSVSMNYPVFTVGISNAVQAPGITNGQNINISTTSDGNGIILDSWAINPYTKQALIRNNVVWGNGSTGLEQFCNGTCQTTLLMIFDHNTAYGNHQDYKHDGQGAECYQNSSGSFGFTFTNNICRATNLQPANSSTFAAWNGSTGVGQGGTGQLVYAGGVGSTGATISGNYFYSMPGATTPLFANVCDASNSLCSFNGQNYLSGNTAGTDPGLAAPASLPTPSSFTGCAAYDNGVSCMNNGYSVYADITPSVAVGKGYQPPSTVCASDALFPAYLKGMLFQQWTGSAIIEKVGLVSKPCGV